MGSMVDPLVAPPPAELPLKGAPLVRVIAQVRFPLDLSVEDAERVAPFQQALRDTYPVLRREQTQSVQLGPSGAVAAKGQTAWRFNDTRAEWRVSLTPDFLALETSKYTSRDDFCDRLRVALEALEQTFNPKQIDRLGLRYIDRITGDAVGDIAKLVIPEVRGILGTPAATYAVHALSDCRFDLPNARVVARWGHIPKGATTDSLALEPVDEPSWILDLDIGTIAAAPFSVQALTDETRSFAERIYTLFRWAVTDEFLRRYGGTP